MPIRIPDSLPAHAILEAENIFVMTEHRAMHQDIRPLNVLILNLMQQKLLLKHSFCVSSPTHHFRYVLTFYRQQVTLPHTQILNI